jgi:hypothetical protein
LELGEVGSLAPAVAWGEDGEGGSSAIVVESLGVVGGVFNHRYGRGQRSELLAEKRFK